MRPEATGLLPAGAGGAEGGLGAAGKGGGLAAAFALPASVLPGAGSCPSLRKVPETPYPGLAGGGGPAKGDGVGVRPEAVGSPGDLASGFCRSTPPA